MIDVCTRLASSGTTEQTGIDGINNKVSAESATCKEATVQTLHRLLTTGNLLEFDPSLASVHIKRDVVDLAVFILTLSLQVGSEFFGPIWSCGSFLPGQC
jgi:hypothetical protein